MPYSDDELHFALTTLEGVDLATALHHVQGRVRSYWKILQKLPIYHRNDIAKLRQALVAQDWETAERLSHSIKGIAATLALQKIYNECIFVNTSIRNQENLEKVEAYLNKIGRYLDNLFIEIETIALYFPDENKQDTTNGKAQLQHLAELLAASDIEASSYFNQHIDLFQQKITPDVFGMIKAAIVHFDYDLAYSYVQGMLGNHAKQWLK